MALFVVMGVPAVVVGQSGGYIQTLGSDTVLAERYERNGNQITGQLVRRLPRTTVLRYKVTLASDGTVAAYEQSVTLPDGTPAPNAAPTQHMTFMGDSVVREVFQNGQLSTVRNAAPKGTLPAIGGSLLAVEMQLVAAKRTGSAMTIGFAGQQQAPAKQDIRFFGADSAEVVTQGFRSGYKLNREGLILRSDGSLTTQKFIGTMVANLNTGAVAAAWAAKDAAGQSLGVASTRDTVNAQVAGANIWIDYGRPAARGREIWGKLVPFDTTWRFGANAATQFKTDKDIMLGGVHVPAGMYTLFLYPTAKEAWLIVNKQTGQWGTAYDAKQDLAKVPLQLHMALKEPEERFHIFIAGDMLMMHWANGGYGVRISGM